MNFAFRWGDSASEAATPLSHNSYQDNRTFLNKPQPPQQHRGDGMSFSNGLSDRSVSGHRRQEPSLRDKRQANQDWLSAKVASYRVAEIVELTGMTERAVHNVRQRKSKLSYDNLVELCQNDPDFAAAFASHVGLILPGQVEFVGALTRAVNAAQRMKGMP